MAILGKTFDYRTVSAGDDGYLYQVLAGGQDFMLSVTGGNPFTISNNVLTIAQSILLISGRFIRIEAGTTISLGTIPSSHTKGRVILRLDMTKLATETQFLQIETEVETTASTYRALVQQSINSIAGQTGNTYEAVICEFTCSSGTASTPTRSLVANPFPVPVAKGGTGATTAASARTNLGVMPFKHYQTSDSWSELSPSLTHIENIYAFAGETSIVDCYFTGNTYRCTAIVNYGGTGWGSLAILERPQGIRSLWSFSKVNNTWYETTSVPRIMRWTFAPKVLTANTYQNYQVTGVTTLSGEAFSTSGAQAWNVVINEAGLYRMDLTLTAPTGSGAIGVFTGHDATPNYSAPNLVVPLTSMIGRLTASGIISVAVHDGFSLIVRCSTTTDELAGTMTLEKLS